MSVCIDCGRQAVSGSAYCAGCDAPILISARDYRDAMIAELEGD